MCHNWWHPTMHMPGLHQIVVCGFEKREEMGVFQTPILYVQILYKVDYDNDEFINKPIYPYNEVMWLCKHGGVVKHE